MKTTRSVILLLVFAGVWSPAFSSENKIRSIHTSGVAEREFAPDRVHLAIALQAVTKSFALSAQLVDQAQASLVGAMQRNGVFEPDVGVRFRSMHHEYEWRREVRVLKGQACVQQVEVIVRDLSRLAEVLESLATIPNLELEGLDYRSSREGEMKREALLLATRAAREKAEAVAAESGVKITGLLEFEERASALNPSGFWNNRAVANNLVVQARSSEPGVGAASQTVRVEVQARYAIE